jgi:hypothetical protein
MSARNVYQDKLQAQFDEWRPEINKLEFYKETEELSEYLCYLKKTEEF